MERQEVRAERGQRPDSGTNALEETLERLVRTLSIGTYMVGDKLPAERDLAVELGVSRATLRVALKELREAGIVQVTRGRYGGTEVIKQPTERHGTEAPVSGADVDDALRFRELLDTEAARLAAQAGLSAWRRRRLTELMRSCESAPMDQYRAFDSQFHIAISELAGIPSLTSAVTENRARINGLLDRIPMMGANLEHANQQHTQILDAVLGAEPDRAAELARDHARGTAALLQGFLASGAEG